MMSDQKTSGVGGRMCQEAPYPTALEQLVKSLRYKPGWRFFLEDIDRGQDSTGLTLVILVRVPDSYHPWDEIKVAHYMIVPPAAFDLRSWRRWLFEQVLLVERHEAMEFFQIHVDEAGRLADPDSGYADRPFAPSHGPGNDPYLVREIGTSEDQRTSYLGELAEAG
jgi:hypothetical protein